MTDWQTTAQYHGLQLRLQGLRKGLLLVVRVRQVALLLRRDVRLLQLHANFAQRLPLVQLVHVLAHVVQPR